MNHGILNSRQKVAEMMNKGNPSFQDGPLVFAEVGVFY